MANILVELHYNSGTKKVEKTYHVLSTGPHDKIQFITDQKGFLIRAKDATLAEGLGLQKTNKAGEYQVTEANPIAAKAKVKPPNPLPEWLQLKCGKLDANGKFEDWGGVGPEGY
jgi:hypothetical protein